MSVQTPEIYNDDSFRPESGKIINSKDQVVNWADSFNFFANILYAASKDGTNREALNTGFGQQRVSQYDNQIAAQFGYLLDDGQVIVETTGTGEVVQEDSMLKIRTTSGAPGTASIESLAALRYIPSAQASLFFTVAGIPVNTEEEPTKYNTAVVRIGNFDDEDGFGGASINGELNIFRRRYNGPGDIETEDIPQSQWNIDKLDGTGPSEFVYNATNGNIFEISWIYLGFGPVVFALKSPDDSWIPIHRIEYPNSSNKTHISLPYLPARVEIDNGTSGQVIELSIGSISGGVYNGGGTGSDSTRRPRGFNGLQEGVVPKLTNGTDYIVAFRGGDLIQDRKNKIASLLNFVSIVSDGAQGGIVELIFNPDILIDGTWARVDGLPIATSKTPVEWSDDTTFDLNTGVSSGLVIALAKVGQFNEFVDELESLLRRSEVVIFKTTGTNFTITQFAIGFFDLY